jgi:hypothetical protein
MIDLDRDEARALVLAYAPLVAAPRGHGEQARAHRLTPEHA